MNFDFLIRLDYIIAGLAFVFLATLQRWLHLREKLLAHPQFYGYASLTIMAIATILVFGHIDFVNPTFSRILNGHLFSWVSIFLAFYIFGYGDVIRGALMTGAFTALHEFVSIGGVFVSGQIYNQYVKPCPPTALCATVQIPPDIITYYYLTFFVFLIGILACYYAFLGGTYNRLLLRVTLIMVIFTAFTVSIGDNSTVNIAGATQWYTNPDVNLTEQLSWIIPTIYLIIEGLVQLLAKQKPDYHTSEEAEPIGTSQI